MVAFTFAGAATRFNQKRMLIAEEINCIETANLRLYLPSHESQPSLQELFRRYVDSRLETYHRLPNMKAAEMEMAKSRQIQEAIWIEVVAATRLPDSHPSSGLLLLPALNNMIDISTTRTMTLQLHPPRIIYCAPVRLGSHLFPAGWVSDVKWPTEELAPYPRLHSPLSNHRIRHARRRVPAGGFDPPRIRRQTARQSPRAYEVTVDDGVSNSFLTAGKGVPFSRSPYMHKASSVACGPRFTFRSDLIQPRWPVLLSS
jgi:hypothetical protein